MPRSPSSPCNSILFASLLFGFVFSRWKVLFSQTRAHRCSNEQRQRKFSSRNPPEKKNLPNTMRTRIACYFDVPGPNNQADFANYVDVRCPPTPLRVVKKTSVFLFVFFPSDICLVKSFYPLPRVNERGARVLHMPRPMCVNMLSRVYRDTSPLHAALSPDRPAH